MPSLSNGDSSSTSMVTSAAPKWWMSPSLISSSRTPSGSSTALTGGTGSNPFHHLNQSILSQEDFLHLPNRPPSPFNNSSSYWDPDILRGGYSLEAHVFQEQTSRNNDVLRKQFERAASGEQSVLAERVSRQLLRDPVKLSPSLDLNPFSPLASHHMNKV